jgi:hypothetical protein
MVYVLLSSKDRIFILIPFFVAVFARQPMSLHRSSSPVNASSQKEAFLSFAVRHSHTYLQFLLKTPGLLNSFDG